MRFHNCPRKPWGGEERVCEILHPQEFAGLSSNSEREKALEKWARRLLVARGGPCGRLGGRTGAGQGRRQGGGQEHFEEMGVDDSAEGLDPEPESEGDDLEPDQGFAVGDEPDPREPLEFDEWEEDLYAAMPPPVDPVLVGPPMPVADLRPPADTAGASETPPASGLHRVDTESAELQQPGEPQGGPGRIVGEPAPSDSCGEPVGAVLPAPVPAVPCAHSGPAAPDTPGEAALPDVEAIARRNRCGPQGWPRFWRPSGMSMRVSRNSDGSFDFRAICNLCGGTRSGTCKSLVHGEVRQTAGFSQGRPLGRIFSYILQGEALRPDHTRAEHAGVPSDIVLRTQARRIAEEVVARPDSWFPRYPAEWQPVLALERPRHQELDNPEGEPYFSR